MRIVQLNFTVGEASACQDVTEDVLGVVYISVAAKACDEELANASLTT